MSILTLLNTALFALFSLVITYADVKYGYIPRFAFIIAFPLFFIFCVFQRNIISPHIYLLGALLGIAIFVLAYFVSGKKLGLADIWYSGLIGLVLGPLWWFPAIMIACLTGAVFIIAFKKQRIPFIPSMAFGSLSVGIVKGWF